MELDVVQQQIHHHKSNFHLYSYQKIVVVDVAPPLVTITLNSDSNRDSVIGLADLCRHIQMIISHVDFIHDVFHCLTNPFFQLGFVLLEDQ